jgi:hypothetical protein
MPQRTNIKSSLNYHPGANKPASFLEMRFFAALIAFTLTAAVVASPAATTSDSNQLARRVSQGSCYVGRSCVTDGGCGEGSLGTCFCYRFYVIRKLSFVCVAVLIIPTQGTYHRR